MLNRREANVRLELKPRLVEAVGKAKDTALTTRPKCRPFPASTRCSNCFTTSPPVNACEGSASRPAARLAEFEPVEASEIPAVYRQLLEHNEHMTVTVEAFHGGPVDVQALEVVDTGSHYCRTSLLLRRSDRRVVQFGVVRLDKSTLPLAARQEIEGRGKPLGRVLIEHNVLREVELSRLWKVATGPELAGHFGQIEPQTTYARTALIHCNGEPAIELLEIVAPVGHQ